MIAHLHAMYECSTAPNGSRDMNSLGHLLDVGPFFQRGSAVSINTIGTLDSMSDRQSDERLFTFGERSFSKGRIIPREKFIPEFRNVFTDIGEMCKIFRVVVSFQRCLPFSVGTEGEFIYSTEKQIKRPCF